jgi:hypothetical protein
MTEGSNELVEGWVDTWTANIVDAGLGIEGDGNAC